MYSHLMNDVAAVRQMERFEAARIEEATGKAKAQPLDYHETQSSDIRSWGTEVVRISKAAWWVPAGVAAMIMLHSILGA